MTDSPTHYQQGILRKPIPAELDNKKKEYIQMLEMDHKEFAQRRNSR